MSTQVRIIIGNVSLRAELFDTACAKAIVARLPIKTEPDEWGDEYYFEIPVTASLDETATTKVKVGDMGYWPPGRALAIFFGRTPMSTGSDPVPASAVNLVGKIIDDATILKKTKGAKEIIIEVLQGA
ncbi:MAG TPA: cyclophilin-like fold protein [Syntrophales bacterium]|nr:cyclophilin-like fold protein [Syntrophales bacterium]